MYLNCKSNYIKNPCEGIKNN